MSQRESEARGAVLIVEDEPEVRELVSEMLKRAGWATIPVATGREALATLQEDNVAVVTLDVNLAEESGYEVCRRIRAVSDVPVIFLTARQDEFDHVLGLEMGADAYLTKPFSAKVLAAQVAAAVRRATPAAPTTHQVAAGHRRLVLDAMGRRVWVDGNEVQFSKIEFDLLLMFASQPGRAFERQRLLNQVWGSWYGDDHVVEVTVGRMRRKLAEAGLNDAIETVRGVGYRLSADVV